MIKLKKKSFQKAFKSSKLGSKIAFKQILIKDSKFYEISHATFIILIIN